MILYKKYKNDTLNAKIFYSFNKTKLTYGFYLYSETRKDQLEFFEFL